MTHNQINYWNYKETGRHNIVVERETERHNRANEAFDLASLNETRRHNYATESLGIATLSETRRHNTETEKVAVQNAQTAQYQAKTQRISSLETIRHDKVSERLDLGKLNETTRHNLQSESLQSKQIDVAKMQVALGYAQLSEASRHNVATEIQAANELQNKIDQLEETTRHNKFGENLALDKQNTEKIITLTNAQLNKARTVTEQLKPALTEAQIQKIFSDINIASENLKIAQQNLELGKEKLAYEKTAETSKQIGKLLETIGPYVQ